MSFDIELVNGESRSVEFGGERLKCAHHVLYILPAERREAKTPAWTPGQAAN